MKILAIRGKNLASLAGDFELHFHREPLASTGLFAICGPTGSGKSTLLDALCLALYDETPRLTHATVKGVSLPDVGDETITPQDPRNLLRRGAGEGLAEVDFVGNDGVAYRARWSVRRARGKASGKLQNTEMLLQTLDGEQRIGGVKNEVQQAIRQRLGLSFPQFTRAVLLAQNEFAMFLKANDNDRAELLETLTGLDVYTRISIRAYERAKAEQQALEALNRQLDGQQTLTTADRAELERKFATAQAETATLEQHKVELDRQLQWHNAWEKLKQGEQQARDTVQTALATRDNAAPRHRYFTQVEVVQDARSLLDAVDRTAGEVVRTRESMVAAQGKLDEARRNRRQADDALAAANQALTAAEQARAAASDHLVSAKELDTEIKTLIPSHAEAGKARDEARAAETKAQETLAGKQSERNRTHQKLKTAQDWLAAHEPLRSLAEDWPRWDLLFNEASKAQSGLREAEKAVTDQRQNEKQRQQARDQTAAALAKAETAFQMAEAGLQTALQTLAGFDAEALAARRETAETRRDQIAHGERLWKELAGALARQQALDDETRALQGRLTQMETALSQVLTDKPVVTARLEQAEKSLKTAEAACAKSVETLRETLEAGSPCPVCGATEHPYATGDAPSRALLAGLKTEVDECRKTVNALDRQEATHQVSLESSRQRLAAIAQEREPLTATLQRDSDAWNAHPVAAELASVAPADRPAWFVMQSQTVGKQLAAITGEENALRQAGKARDAAQGTRDQAQQQHSTARDTLNAAQTALDQAAQAVRIASARQAEAAQRLRERLIALDAAFPGPDWRSNWQADPVAFHHHQREQAAQWNTQSKTVEQLQIRLGTLEIEINNLAVAAAEKSAQLQRATGDFEKADRHLQDKRQQRQALFGGRPAAAVEAEFAQGIETARTHLQKQDEEARKAAQAQTSAETVLEQAQLTLDASQRTAEQAGAALNAWMATFNARHPDVALTAPQLRALLAHDRDWLTREREALRALADAVSHAETILKERQSQRETHERQRTSLNLAETVQAAHQQIVLDLDNLKRRCAEADLALRQDNDRHAKTAALQADLAKQRATAEIWEKLNSLVGSADGKKFRNYAQQFTLDVLLGYANRHLADVSRRYRLERVKDALALMVVDQDMGDECRSVHSLSGGESFLVSLALALGLASLSSNRVRVESLFIDEGFGSLDADTLRVAMDALDNLQAQGRKVGVISHVQEMTERIGIQIQVRRQSGGQSRIEVQSG